MLSDSQWARLEPLLPQYSSAGRPWKDNRAVLEGILWILKTGARWRDLPADFGVSPATCWRRLRLWEEQGGMAQGVATISGRVGSAGPTGLEREFHRRKFRFRQKGGDGVGKTKRGKGTKWMVVVDGQGIPLGNHLDRASPAEVTLVERTLGQVRVARAGRGRPKTKPTRLIADRAYDSGPLRRRLHRRGIQLNLSASSEPTQSADPRWPGTAPLPRCRSASPRGVSDPVAERAGRTAGHGGPGGRAIAAGQYAAMAGRAGALITSAYMESRRRAIQLVWELPQRPHTPS